MFNKPSITTQYLLYYLIILPIVAAAASVLNYRATVDVETPTGSFRAPVNSRVVVARTTVERFVERCISESLEIDWRHSANRYQGSDKTRCFSTEAWERFKATQRDDNIVPYLTERQFSRFAVASAPAAVVGVTADEDGTYYLVQSAFLITIRGGRSQESTRHIVHAIVRTAKAGDQRALEVIGYDKKRIS